MAKRAPARPQPGRLALVLGGGAPTLTLMSGALVALDEEGVAFDVIATSGAGMLVGLLYAAPKGTDRQTALRETVNLGVHDAIYQRFPINYKVFYKPGQLAELYYRMVMPWVHRLPQASSNQRLVKDLVHLWASMWSPSSLLPSSQGMCAAAPWLEDVIDFEALRTFPADFLLNAWNIRARRMDIFDKTEITPDHFRAGLAFPLIYPPFRMNGDHYFEGSAMDTLNLRGLLRYDMAHNRSLPGLLRREIATRWADIVKAAAKGGLEGEHRVADLVDKAIWESHKASLELRDAPQDRVDAALMEAAATFVHLDADAFREVPQVRAALDLQDGSTGDIDAIDKIVVFDALGTAELLHPPRDLYDAWIMQMIVPLVSISSENIRLFEKEYDYPEDHPRKILHRLRFADQISHAHWLNVLDWSYSNLETLFHAGYRAGKAFFAEHEWLRERTAVRGGAG